MGLKQFFTEKLTCTSHSRQSDLIFINQQRSKNQVETQGITMVEKQIEKQQFFQGFPSLDFYHLPFWLFMILRSTHKLGHCF